MLTPEQIGTCEMKTPEQEARDIMERMGIENAQQFTAGDVVELANLIADHRRLQRAIHLIGKAVEDYAKRCESC